jgi:prepilin-type N-terminal cleavage/methylation domain-containing protein
VDTRRERLGCGRGGRLAFTLLEIVVVLTIILVLAAITAGAVLRYTTTQQGYNTQSLLRKLQARLDTQVRLVAQRAMQEPIGTGCVGTGSTTGAAAVSSAQAAIFHIANNAPDKARVIWVKLRLKQAFPNSFAEALNPDNGYFANIVTGVSLPPLPTYQKYLNNAGVTFSSGTLYNGIPAPNSYYESSACLLLALQGGQSGGGISADDIGPSFLRDFPLNGTTVKLIVDGWDTPVAFCRWPWGCYAINPSGAPPGSGPQPGIYNPINVSPSQATPNDPSDPRGVLCDYLWVGALATVGGGVSGVTIPAYPPTYPTIQTSSTTGLSVGQTVTIASVAGATGANGTWTVISVPNSTSFEISGGAPGTFTSGGTVSGPAPTTDAAPPTGFTTFVGEFQGLLGYVPPPWTGVPSTTTNSQSYILTPVIVSAGPDRQMGLDPTQGLLLTGPTPDPAYDNVYSTQLQ